MKIINILLVICFLTSCKGLFLTKGRIVHKQTGVLVIVDDSLRKFRNQSGHVFTDSLLPDFFVPFKFKKKTVSILSIENAFFSKKNKEVDFISIRGDCDGAIRRSSIDESIAVLFDRNIDEYLGSKKLNFLPVEISYLHGAASFDYLTIHKSLAFKKNSDTANFFFRSGYLDILRLDVLEYEWPSNSK